MPQLFSNNGSALLAQDLFVGGILAVVNADFGGRFPLPIGPTDFFIAVLDDGLGNLEVVKCTLRNGDSMVLERAQEGTIERDFPAGSRFGCRISAGTMAGFVEPDQAVFGGPVNLNANALINGEILGIPIRGESGDVSNEMVVPPLDAKPTIGGIDILTILDNPLVAGMVFMYSGNPLALPPNWNLCDGTNGTPDLRSRFIVSYKAGDPTFGTMHATGGNPTSTDPAGAHDHGGFAVVKILTQANIPTLTLTTHSGVSSNSGDNHNKTNQAAAGANSSNTLSTTAVEYINASPTLHDHVLNGELDHTHDMIPAYYTLAYVQFAGVQIAPVFSGNLADEAYVDSEVITPVDTTLEFNEGNGTSPTYGATGLPTGLSIAPTGPGRGIISGTVDGAASGGSPYAVQVTLTTSIAPPAISNIASWIVDAPPLFTGNFAAETYVDGETITPIDMTTEFDEGTASNPTYTATGLPVGLSITATGPGRGIISGTVDSAASDSSPYSPQITLTTDAGFAVSNIPVWTINPIPLLAVIDPVDFVASCTIQGFNGAFEVSWDGGSTFTPYISGNPTNASQVPTGQITVRSFAPTFNRIRFATDTYTSIDIQSAAGLINAQIMCSSLSALTSFSMAKSNNVTDMSSAWSGCTGLTSFPLIDISSALNLSNAWDGCSGLTSFPLLVTGSVTNMTTAWDGCVGLTSFPLIDTSNVTNLAAAWRTCTGLTSFPLIDVSSAIPVSGLNSTWQLCTGLTTFPLIDTSLMTSFNNTWSSCSGLTTFPLINTSAVTSLQSTWQSCTGLTSFPLIDMSAVTTASSVWAFCSGLTSFPAISTPVLNSTTSLFRDCTNLVCISSLDTTAAVTATSIFLNCPAVVAPTAGEITSLETVPPGLNYVNAGACP